MKKVLTSIFLMLFTVFQLFAQKNEKIHISGKIVNTANNRVLQYATISLTKVNSEDIEGTISDKNGKFDIYTQVGTYILKIEYLSFEDKIYTNFKLTKNIDLGVILLTEDSESLETVDVSGKSKLTTIKLGKVVYNVEKDISSEGSSAIDILANVPSVNINSENIPTIRGSSALILINGRMSSMTKLQALQNLQASSIKSIEVITTPSARYGTGVEGGIINIILKKGLDNGLNGSVTATGGYKNIFGGATSINYRKNKVNIYTNTSYFNRDLYGESTIENEFLNNGNSTGFLNEDLTNSRKDEVLNTSLGFDYYINDYIYLNIEGSLGKYVRDLSTTNIGNYYDLNNSLTLSKEQLGFTDFTNDIYDVSITYDQYFERENEELYISFSHKNDLEINDTELYFSELFPTNIALPDNDELIYDEVLLQNTEWHVAYVLPINKKSTLEMGSQGVIGSLKTDFINQKLVGGIFEPDPNTTNRFNYNEDHYGIYSEYKIENEKTSFKLGLTIDQTEVKTNLVLTNEITNQKYLEFFPSVHINFIKDEFKSIGFAYRRDIGRAKYIDLNPFEQRFSETTSFQGNINLTPVFINSFELSFLNEKESKFSIKPTAYFRHYQDFWQYVTVETGEIVNGNPKLLTTPVNLGAITYTGLEFLLNHAPSDWLEFDSTIDLRYVNQTGIYEYRDSNNMLTELDYNSDNISGSLKLNTTIALPFDINFQSLIQYEIASRGAYSERYGYAYMNASLNKELLNKKATLTLSAKDIFNSKQIKRLRWSDDFKSQNKSQWREPSILLSFTYRFNQSKKDKTLDIHINDEKEKN